LLKDGEKEFEIVYGEEPNEATKEGPLSFVPFESPFASVSTVSRGHLSLVYLKLVHFNQGRRVSSYMRFCESV
jgi:hypothetical protein